MELVIFFAVVVAILVSWAVFVHDDKPTEPTVDADSVGIKEPQVQRLQYFCIKDKGYHISVWPKDQGVGDYLEFPITGITHGEHVADHLGESIATLTPEPTNPYDSNAIAIITPEGHRLGYVPKDMTAEVRRLSNLPCPCYCYIGQQDGKYFTDCYLIIQY